MERIKRMIIICLVILVLAILIFAIINIFQKEQNKIEEEEVLEHEHMETYVNTEMGPVTDYIEYITAIRYINSYLSTSNKNSSAYYGYDEDGNYTFVADEQELKENIYNLLSKQFIEKNKVTIENIWEHVPEIKQEALFVPIEIGEYRNVNITKHVVYGILENLTDNKYISDMCIIITLDNTTGSYSIEPINEKYKTIKDIKVEEIEEEIERNQYNAYEYAKVNDDDIIKDYYNNYKKLILGYPEKAYELLEEEYKKVRFPTLDSFKKYIQENKKQISKSNVQKYQISTNDEKKQFICADQNNNYYIFQEEEILKYKAILDIYSIDLPEFLERYNTSDENEKILLNVQKIFYAINMGDYKYVYQKLDENFKNNYFKTEADFEKYIKENLYKYNKISYGKYEKNQDVYIYNVNISNSENKEDSVINKKLVMKLKEGTDFVFSFNI